MLIRTNVDNGSWDSWKNWVPLIKSMKNCKNQRIMPNLSNYLTNTWIFWRKSLKRLKKLNNWNLKTMIWTLKILIRIQEWLLRNLDWIPEVNKFMTLSSNRPIIVLKVFLLILSRIAISNQQPAWWNLMNQWEVHEIIKEKVWRIKEDSGG